MTRIPITLFAVLLQAGLAKRLQFTAPILSFGFEETAIVINTNNKHDSKLYGITLETANIPAKVAEWEDEINVMDLNTTGCEIYTVNADRTGFEELGIDKNTQAGCNLQSSDEEPNEVQYPVVIKSVDVEKGAKSVRAVDLIKVVLFTTDEDSSVYTLMAYKPLKDSSSNTEASQGSNSLIDVEFNPSKLGWALDNVDIIHQVTLGSGVTKITLEFPLVKTNENTKENRRRQRPEQEDVDSEDVDPPMIECSNLTPETSHDLILRVWQGAAVATVGEQTCSDMVNVPENLVGELQKGTRLLKYSHENDKEMESDHEISARIKFEEV